MKSSPISIRWHRLVSVDSTQTWAREHLDWFDRDALNVVEAQTQTGGYGRRMTPWISPPGGNLYVSFVYWLDADQEQIEHLSQLLALCAYHVLPPLPIQFKWPNDLLIEGKKVAGALTEIFPVKQDKIAISGIGINLNTDPASLQLLDQPTTSIVQQYDGEVDRETLLRDLASEFAKNLEIFRRQGFAPFEAELSDLTLIESHSSC